MSALWITMNNSTRSKQLSLLLNLPIFIYKIEKPEIARHFGAFFWALIVLFKHRPRVIYTQYSFILQCAIYIYSKQGKNIDIIVDFHNKALARELTIPIIKDLYSILKKKTIKISSLGVATNKLTITKLQGFLRTAKVLPDPCPDIRSHQKFSFKNGNKINVTYISSFAEDEPHNLIYETAESLLETHDFYVTGKIPSKFDRDSFKNSNLVFTDYLSDADYHSLLSSSDILVCLTTDDSILQCSIYESLMLNKRIIVNNSQLNISTFGNCVEYTDLSSAALQASIQGIFEIDRYRLIHDFIQEHKSHIERELSDLRKYQQYCSS